MDCRTFRSRIEDVLASPEEVDLLRHAEACPGCRLVHRRAALVGRALRVLPAERPGPSLDEAVIRGVRGGGRRTVGDVLRVAAAALLLASGGLAALLGLSPGRARESLALKVVVETAAEGDPRDLVLEEMYGPRVPEGHPGTGDNGATMR